MLLMIFVTNIPLLMLILMLFVDIWHTLNIFSLIISEWRKIWKNQTTKDIQSFKIFQIDELTFDSSTKTWIRLKKPGSTVPAARPTISARKSLRPLAANVGVRRLSPQQNFILFLRFRPFPVNLETWHALSTFRKWCADSGKLKIISVALPSQKLEAKMCRQVWVMYV